MCLSPRKIVTKREGCTLPSIYLVSCGKCVECLIRKANEWAYRCMEEAKLYKNNCFVTLTYNDENLPTDGNLVRRDVQNFVKRLRSSVSPKRIRFFYCGEYGLKNLRPHYHLIIFNHDFLDKWFFKRDKKGTPLFRSSELEELWPFGFSSVAELTFESARYCAKYLQKLRSDITNLVPPFIGMSLKPGIGYSAITPEILTRGGISKNGKSIPIPRYFLKVLSQSHDLEEWKELRYRSFLHRFYLTDAHWSILNARRKKWKEKIYSKRLT